MKNYRKIKLSSGRYKNNQENHNFLREYPFPAFPYTQIRGVGNYKFRISPRKMEKNAWAMGLPHVVLQGAADSFPYKDYPSMS